MLAMPITEMSVRNFVVMKTRLETDGIPVNEISHVNKCTEPSARGVLWQAAMRTRADRERGEPNACDCTIYRYAIDAQIGSGNRSGA
jgi:hypothetical protein